MLSSDYRRESVLFGVEGGPVPPILAEGGVFARNGGAYPVRDEQGRVIEIAFPAQPEWHHDSLERPPSGQPWPGWHSVAMNPVETLRSFANVNDWTSALAFASEYGPLWECENHPYPCLWLGSSLPDVNGRSCKWRVFETLDAWLEHADAVSGVLMAIATVRQDETLSRKQWSGLGFRTRTLRDIWPSAHPRQVDKAGIAATINDRLQRYNMRLSITNDLEPALWAGTGFIFQVWMQLAAVAAGGVAIAVCSACSRPYVRSQRAARRGQRNYCPKCNEAGARQRLSSRSKSEGAAQ